jgi:Tfp pilus assembly protein PilO
MKIPDLLNKLQLAQIDQKKIILIAMIGLTLLYADFSFVLKSQVRGLKNAQAKITKLRKDISDLSQEVARAQALKSKQGSSGSSRKAKRIISDGEIASLLERLSVMANQENIKIMQAKPIKDTKAKDASGNAPCLINLELVCGYHSLGKFINGIENIDILIALDSLNIDVNPADYLKQKVTLGLKTYVKK